MHIIRKLVSVCFVIFGSKSALASNYCAENQTAVLGEQGTIDCNFPGEFYRVVWFDDVSVNSLFVISCATPCDTKYGPGYRSGEYDIFQNGSLSILKVTARHEGSYEVIIYLTTAFFEKVTVFLKVTGFASNYCSENQTAELGEQGTIDCNFPADFYRVVWFDDVSKNSSFVISCMTPCDTKHGPAYRSGEYDIFQNGSLSILNVTARHEGSYEVIIYLTAVFFEKVTVFLKVIASPGVLLMSLNGKDRHQQHYQKVFGNETLTCSVNAARPPVQLEWFQKTFSGDIVLELLEKKVVENENGTFNSLVSVHIYNTTMGELITLVACREKWMQKVREEIQLLLDNSRQESFSSETRKDFYFEINRRAEIRCEGSSGFVNLWNRIFPNNSVEPIGFIADGTAEIMTNSQGIKMSSEGSLIFQSLEIGHEGTYACAYRHDMESEVYVTNITVLIPPSPPYIQIEGCEDVDHSCALEGRDHHQLVSSVFGVHPVVSLEWITSEDSEGKIAYHNQELITEKRGSTYDVFLSVDYELVSEHKDCGDDVKITCRLRGPVSHIMKAERTVVLTREACEDDRHERDFAVRLEVFAGVCICFTIIIIVGLFAIVAVLLKKTTVVSDPEEYIPMNRTFERDDIINYETSANNSIETIGL